MTFEELDKINKLLKSRIITLYQKGYSRSQINSNKEIKELTEKADKIHNEIVGCCVKEK